MQRSMYAFLVLFLSLCHFADGQPGPLFVPCLDTMVINAREVFVARVVQTCREGGRCSASNNVIVEIEKWMKGGGRDGKLQYRIEASDTALSEWKMGTSRLLVFGSQGNGKAIDLSDPELKVLTADMEVVRVPEVVLDAAQRAIDNHRNIYGILTFRRRIPLEAAKAVGRGWDMVSEVPADSELENWAIAALNSSEAGERADAAAALGYFPSEVNAERLKLLLEDPALSENGPGAVNIYFVRQNAYKSLQRMGLKVAEPVLEK